MKYSPSAQTHRAPFASIILPIRNEARTIRRCLEAILAQDYPAERYEVIVVDGMSDDGTREIVREFCNRDNRLRMLDRQDAWRPGL